jgi:DNA replication initiation complex subunit (GINS family)
VHYLCLPLCYLNYKNKSLNREYKSLNSSFLLCSWGIMDQETESKDINITYDTLFEILRNEKTKDDLQKLHPTFLQDTVTYLNEKQANLAKASEQKSLFESDEREKTIQQIGNIKRIIRDIYERREKKIIGMAINKSRFSSSIMDTASLLEEEKRFYDLLVSLLANQREQMLHAIINGRLPEQIKQEIKLTTQDFTQASDLTKAQEPEVPAKLIRFLTAVPQFMGTDLREYGPYEEEDVAKLPIEISNLLIEKERAEEIKEG